ncbi:alpha/beta hydrolase [Geminicoccaceae bacterium 1502E]|nr:alpha/beta hydrolase [Geminicoccaceae bacterium 1502E]
MSEPAAAAPVFIQTYGRTAARGQRRAFLVHGAGMDQSVWTLQGRYLAFHGWDAYAVDLPGHGRSHGRPALPDIGSMADWLGGVIAQGDGEPATLIGHSMGALIALELAARRPELVARLCLLGAAAAMPVHPSLLELAAQHDPRTVELMVDWAFGRRGHVGGNAVPGGWMMGSARNLLLRGDPAVLSSDLAACSAYGGGAKAAAAVRCPTLVVIASEDRMTPPRAGRELASLIPEGRSVPIEGAGHMVMLESPEETLEAIRSFLA